MYLGSALPLSFVLALEYVYLLDGVFDSTLR
jgi:hypothetical protein